MGATRDTLVNPATGEEVTFLAETPALLVMDARWPRPGRRTAPHVHPRMEERWVVLEGAAAFRIGDEELAAAAGDVVVAAPGVPHVAWNAGATPARVRIEMRPALRWRAFVERLFGQDGLPDQALLQDFADEVAPPPATAGPGR